VRKILFLTGIRSDYDILYPILCAIEASNALDAGLVVAGAHLSDLFGQTVHEVEKDGFPILARVESLSGHDDRTGRGRSAARLLERLLDICESWKPDLLFAAMDREEALAMALAGAYLNLPVAHLGGGDVSGDLIDDNVRNAVTKLAHLHLVHTEASGARVRAMGEDEWRILTVGAPGLDRWRLTPGLSDEELARELGLGALGRFALVIHHPDHGEEERSGESMRLLLDTLLAQDLPVWVSYPNSDPGSHRSIAIIEEFSHANPGRIRHYRNLSRAVFLALLRRASVLVGNSSCGIVEAPFLGLPVVSPGPRQRGRECGANVQFVDYAQPALAAAIRRAVHDPAYRESLAHDMRRYGDGKSGERIARALTEIPLGPRLLDKRGSAWR
jgi:UDP-hydrolysing UDP-N-acetyl-D-glucosamine 2-epimerase